MSAIDDIAAYLASLETSGKDIGQIIFDELTPVVRCRDCKHYTDDEMEYYHYCGSWCEQVTPDGYCAWGERRDA